MAYKFFDIHTDIIYDVYKAALKKDFNRFEAYHANQLNKSNVKAGVWTLYSPDDFNLLDAYTLALKNIDMHKVKDFEVILGLEGLRNLKDLEEFKALYNLGVRHAMLTWNEENNYATGVFGNPLNGLTKKGYEVLDFMIAHDMIIDLSHLNDKSFDDVIKYTQKNIIASHSNARSLCDHPRNLTDDQLVKLKQIDALVGLTNIGKFIAVDTKDRNINSFINHIIYMIEKMGINNVCLGFDFMDYFNQEIPSNLLDLPNVNEAHKVIDLLEKRGLTSEDIQKVAYHNFNNRFSRHKIKK